MIKKPMLDAVVDVFNAHPELAAGLAHVNIDEHALAFGIQEGLDAVVVHLIGVHGADVVLVGTPSRDARRRLAVLCEHIGRAWDALGTVTYGPREACARLALPEGLASVNETTE